MDSLVAKSVSYMKADNPIPGAFAASNMWLMGDLVKSVRPGAGPEAMGSYHGMDARQAVPSVICPLSGSEVG
jgi:hypothetical protein